MPCRPPVNSFGVEPRDPVQPQPVDAILVQLSMARAKIPNTLQRQARQLFEDEAVRAEFMIALTEPRPFPVAVVWMQDRPVPHPFTAQQPFDWLPEFIDLVSIDQRPGRHELHNDGHYYCLDPSSVFMAQALSVVPTADTVLDLCAAPGGKSLLAWRMLQPARLFSNEVVGKRIGGLISNLKRCRVAPAVVLNVDPKVLAEQAPSSAEVVIVDAPCSGQSLPARGKESPGCFHPATINMNANRQRRILANAAATVRPGGWLAYMTCTYALKENERNVDWFLRRFPDFESVPVSAMDAFRSSYSDAFCYRLWPMQAQGAGGFFATFRKRTDADSVGPLHDLTQLRPRWQNDGQGSATSVL